MTVVREPIRTWIVGRRSLLAEGVIACLERSRFGVVQVDDAAARNTIWSVEVEPPTLCLLISECPSTDGITQAKLRSIRQSLPDALIVVLALKISPDMARPLAHFVDACLSLTYSTEQIVFFLEEIIAGNQGLYIFPRTVGPPDDPQSLIVEGEGVVRCAATQARTTVPLPIEPQSGESFLSPREREVLAGLFNGESNKTLARRLAISDATVKAHVRAVFRKLDAHSRTQAVRRVLAICPQGTTVDEWLRADRTPAMPPTSRVDALVDQDG